MWVQGVVGVALLVPSSSRGVIHVVSSLSGPGPQRSLVLSLPVPLTPGVVCTVVPTHESVPVPPRVTVDVHVSPQVGV